MFYKYLISNVSDKEVLYLFLDNRYEISSEFSKDIKEDSIQNKIKSYIKKNNINFNKGTIYLVTNNIIAASINYNNDEFTKVKEYIDIKNSDDNLEIIDVTNINNRERILIKNNKTYYRIPLTKYLEDKNKRGV